MLLVLHKHVDRILNAYKHDIESFKIADRVYKLTDI